MQNGRNGANGKPQARRARRPARMSRGIEMRWQGGQWVFRARMESAGRVIVGAWHDDQVRAVEDRAAIALKRDLLPDRVLTFGDALARVIRDAQDRGLPEATVRKHYQCHVRYLQRWWRPEVRMVQLTAAELRWFVREALEQGRSPNTLLQKDLPILEQAFGLAGLSSPVGEVRTAMRSQLKFRPPRMQFWTPTEVVALIDRMRREDLWHPKPCEACAELDDGEATGCQVCGGWRTVDDRERPPRQLPGREADADLVEFLASTGVRAGELGRVRIEHVDLERRSVHVATPKDRGNPRDLVVPASLRPVVERLVRRAQDLVAAGRNPDRLLVPGAMVWLANLGRRWKERLRDPRINGRAFRHTFVTGTLAAGVHPNDARDLAGHKSLKTTDRYVHVISGRRESAAQQWAEHLERIRTPVTTPPTDPVADALPPAGESPP